jgi:hypothetical protein
MVLQASAVAVLCAAGPAWLAVNAAHAAEEPDPSTEGQTEPELDDSDQPSESASDADSPLDSPDGESSLDSEPSDSSATPPSDESSDSGSTSLSGDTTPTDCPPSLGSPVELAESWDSSWDSPPPDCYWPVRDDSVAAALRQMRTELLMGQALTLMLLGAILWSSKL